MRENEIKVGDTYILPIKKRRQPVRRIYCKVARIFDGRVTFDSFELMEDGSVKELGRSWQKVENFCKRRMHAEDFMEKKISERKW